MFLREMELWLKKRGTMSLQDGFVCAFPKRPMTYLRIPSLSDVQKGSDDVLRRWNRLVTDTFARTELYRRPEEELWQELELLHRDMTRLEKEICQPEEFRLVGQEPEFDDRLCMGREQELRKLETLFGRDQQKLAVLCGQGGMGKSMLARAYAGAQREKYHTVVFASCEVGLQRLLGDDSQLCVQGMSYVPGGKRSELGWYCRKKLKVLGQITDAGTLLILDNLDRQDPYLEEFKKLPCHLLITTRMRGLAAEEATLEVKPLSEDAQLALFSRSSGLTISKEMQPELKKVLNQFGGNTLRIRQLGAYYAGRPELSMEDLNIFLGQTRPIFRLDSLSAVEQTILRCAALLPLKGMAWKTFLTCCGNRIAKRQLMSLHTRGLLEYEEAEGRIYLHPLVKEEVVALLKPDWSSCRTYVRNFRRMMADFWNFPREKKAQVSEYILSLLNQLFHYDVHALPEIFPLVDLLWQMGQWEAAMRDTKRLYEFCRQKLGEAHEDTAWAAHLVGSVYYNQNQMEQAGAWYQRAWLIFEHSSAKQKSLVREGILCVKYSRYLLQQGEIEAMEQMYQRIESLYHWGLMDTLQAEKRHALEYGLQNFYIEKERVYRRLERIPEALKVCEQALELNEAIDGGSATRAYVHYDMGCCLADLEHYEEALRCLEAAEEESGVHFPDDNRERIRICRELARVREVCRRQIYEGKGA